MSPINYGDTLPGGYVLRIDDVMQSRNRMYKFVNRADGNLCIYHKYDTVSWVSGTPEQHEGRADLFMGIDGNLVLWDDHNPSGRRRLWASDTSGKGTGPYRLVMQDDGNLVIYDGNAVATWATNTAVGSEGSTRDTLPSGDVLQIDDKLVSKNKMYKFVNQADGNLCVYPVNKSATWSSGSWNKGHGTLHMQTDGNLVLYKDGGQAIWNSGMWYGGTGPWKLIMQDDGNLVIYDKHSVPIWATNTGVGS